MRWTSTYAHPKELKFIIFQDPYVGFYLYVYEEPAAYEDDLKDKGGDCPSYQDNYLQDDLEMAQFCAHRVFGVPEDSWIEIE